MNISQLFNKVCNKEWQESLSIFEQTLLALAVGVVAIGILTGMICLFKVYPVLVNCMLVLVIAGIVGQFVMQAFRK